MTVFEEILKNKDYSKLGENIKVLINTDGSPLKKKINIIFNKYNEALENGYENVLNLLNAMYKSFTGYTISSSMDIISCYLKENDEILEDNSFEGIGANLFYDKLYDMPINILAINILKICKDYYNDLIDNFMITICGYSINTIIDYMCGLDTCYNAELSRIIEKF